MAPQQDSSSRQRPDAPPGREMRRRHLGELASEPIWYVDDLRPGDWIDYGSYHATGDAIRDYARQWDPLPIHLAGDDRVIASGMHTLAIMQGMQAPVFHLRLALVAGRGFDFLDLPRPVRPGMTISGWIGVLDIILRERRGDIVTLSELHDENGDTLLRLRGVQVLRRRHYADGEGEGEG